MPLQDRPSPPVGLHPFTHRTPLVGSTIAVRVALPRPFGLAVCPRLMEVSPRLGATDWADAATPIRTANTVINIFMAHLFIAETPTPPT
jgi:hypothetical protein